ncbi:hypothetical protein C4565_05570 [Candidatus Parcubacteria bacterium]|nr:MAG: hypothetical protein C4565_05570 [Candidatus Parcubacteria bacterium]
MGNKQITEAESKKIITSLSTSFLIVSNIFLFGPFIIYQGNIDEFLIPLKSILFFFFLPAIVFVILLSIIGLGISKKLYRRYLSLLFIIGILLWMQGNVLVWKYGLLDGQGFNWAEGAWRGWFDGLIWFTLIFIACKYFKQIYKIAALTSIGMIFLQLFFLAFVSIQKPEAWQEKVVITPTKSMPKALYQFSSKQNVLIFLLDSFQSDFFQDIINEDFNYYSDKLEGFTYFKETTGSFPTTYMTLPALFSGKNYKNDIPMLEFFNTTMQGETISNALYESGYDIDLVDIAGIPGTPGHYSIRYQIPVPYGVTSEHYTQASSALMLDIVLFRYVPHFFKRYIYNDQRWLMQRLLFTKLGTLSNKEIINGSTFHYFAHEAFLTDLYDHLTVGRTEPIFKFFHIKTPHAPIVVNNECKYAGKPLENTRESKKNQCKCSLEHIFKILVKLKQKGIYDSSLIVMMADTGDSLKVELKNMDKKIKGYNVSDDKFSQIVGSALPLMLIKRPFSEGPLKTSTSQTMISDLPATISSILKLKEKFNGRSMFEIDPREQRERKFFYYEWQHKNWQDEYLERIDEFIIKGSVFDLDSWQYNLAYFSPQNNQSDKSSIDIPVNGLTFDIGSSDEGLLELKGFSVKETDFENSCYFRWTIGKNSRMIFNGLRLPKRSRVSVTFDVEPFIVNINKKMIIKSKLSTAEVVLKPGLSKYDVIIEFPEGEAPILNIYYDDAASPKSLAMNKDTRILSAKWNKIKLHYESKHQ